MRRLQPHRRSARALLLLAAAFLLVPDYIARAESPAWEDVDVGGLPEYRSEAGILSLTMHAAAQPVMIGPVQFDGMIYDGVYAGPVWRVRPGDTVEVKFVNDLPEPTNLHFHGLRVSPQGRGDNMHIVVPPGATQQYSFKIPPGHPPGLFWFHDHLHGSTDPHVMAGLSGTILIEGFSSQFTNLGPVSQKLLVMKDYTRPDCTQPALKTEFHCRLITINGKLTWPDTIRPGETQLWRIANEGADFTLHLAVKGARLRIIGRDGMPVPKAEPAAAVDIMPASRADILVDHVSAEPATILALHVPSGAGEHFSSTRVLGSVTQTGLALPGPDETRGEPAARPQRDLRTLPIDARRTMTFSEDSTSTKFYIDNKLFDHDRIDVRVPLGNVEEWTIRNQTQDFHEFHIHQIGFQVTEINGVKQDFAGLIDDADVPAMGEIKVILPFTDPIIVGKFMYHCHVLRHEDGGMMGQIEVYQRQATAAPAICHPPPETGGAPQFDRAIGLLAGSLR